MTVMPPRSTITIAVAATLASAVLLTGCGSPGITLPTSEGGVSVSGDGSQVQVESDAGSFSAGSGALPDGFPEAEIPVLDGEIVSSMYIDEGTASAWSVTVLAPAGGDPMAEARSALEAAGFSAGTSGDMFGMKVVELTNGTYRVVLSVVDQDDQVAVQYGVNAVRG